MRESPDLGSGSESDPLSRIADALERLSPPPPDLGALATASSFVWRPGAGGLVAAPVKSPPLRLLLEVERQKGGLLANTRRFAAGSPANNALLWGVRGAGKSALVKAIHAEVSAEAPLLKLIETPREDFAAIPSLIAQLQEAPFRVILFVDDLSFEGGETAMKALKPALEGGLAAQNANLLVYATSNRRHLVSRDARENDRTDLHWSDTAEERLALADRFGLWLGFHALDQDGYLRIVSSYAAEMKLDIAPEDIRKRALQWSMERAARSGRTAWQFITALAGELGERN
ncbi:MAG: ATP-binding protein [Alphaproteobacteria bacterium]|nr:ATP-binding protein [Alphaproteobacteria bacterium]